jgi:hypothetical protein
MVTLANLYALSDWSIQQLAIGLAMLPLLVALAWYVSHPVHRRHLSTDTPRPGTRARSRNDGSLAKEPLPRACSEPAPLLPHVHGTDSEIIGMRVEA